MDQASSTLANRGSLVKRPGEEGQGIIVSFHDNFAEAHDGNCSLVAWVLYRRLRGESILWKYLKNGCYDLPIAMQQQTCEGIRDKRE